SSLLPSLYLPLRPPHLPSFPTRRSSDLSVPFIGGGLDGPLSSAGFAGATFPGGRSRKGGSAPLRALPLPGLVPRVLADHACHPRSEEHTSELQSRFDLVCRLLLEKKNNN